MNVGQSMPAHSWHPFPPALKVGTGQWGMRTASIGPPRRGRVRRAEGGPEKGGYRISVGITLAPEFLQYLLLRRGKVGVERLATIIIE